MKLPELQTLERIYGETERSMARYQSLADNYKKYFMADAAGASKSAGKDTAGSGADDCEVQFFTSPGRTEIVGNHTDHNGGKILAGSISLDTIGAACPNGTDVITIISEGYRDRIIVDLTRLERVPKNKGTFSLVAGMAMAARKMGFTVSGFNAYVSTEVISAAGVSSSASFEMLVCAIINTFFNDGKMRCIDYARIGQYAENHFWDKASGLMDQMACAVGGTILLDFSKEDENICKQVDFSFSQLGYDLVIVNTGKGHADLSDEYSSVPLEMKETAKALGAKLLCETSEEALLEKLADATKDERAVPASNTKNTVHSDIAARKLNNDRAILRALHFFEENKRVDTAYQAALDRDEAALLKAIDESGRSSWEWLQNCYCIRSPKEQKVSLTLALTRLFLNRTGRGVCRVHGGGFAGVIACVLPKEETADYVNYIAQFVGKENVYPMNIRTFGAGPVMS
ncbi:MAG: galactokinase [Lachnospiraceae bacterium]|nr:galactokinase [Lachnospiraceae bacterium]